LREKKDREEKNANLNKITRGNQKGHDYTSWPINKNLSDTLWMDGWIEKDREKKENDELKM